MNQKIIKPDPSILEFLEYASKEVEKMPSWKKGILEASSRAFNTYDRFTQRDTEDPTENTKV